jgi:ABC-type antimicrobial peptide transport system permease subunit
MLFSVGGFDLVTVGASVATLSVVALFAGLLPARHVAAVDRLTALRTE